MLVTLLTMNNHFWTQSDNAIKRGKEVGFYTNPNNTADHAKIRKNVVNSGDIAKVVDGNGNVYYAEVDKVIDGVKMQYTIRQLFGDFSNANNIEGIGLMSGGNITVANLCNIIGQTFNQNLVNRFLPSSDIDVLVLKPISSVTAPLNSLAFPQVQGNQHAIYV